MEGVFMAYVEINYRNFGNEELRKLIKIHTNIAYPVPEESVYLPIEIRSDFVCTSTKQC
jgi:hypothetical protein